MPNHHDQHDDFGGLHRDLVATGAELGRRRWLRLTACVGSAVGTAQLIECSGDTPTSPSATTDTTTTTTTTPPNVLVTNIGGGLSFGTAGVPNGVYYVRLRAVGPNGSSVASNEVTLIVL